MKDLDQTLADDKRSTRVTFALVTSLFFIWAFLHNINPILIPHLKKACQLTDTQSALIDTAVYAGYFTIALPAGWFMHKFGYKKGILLGLLLYAVGALLFVPAASARSYPFFLFALFVIASGATFLETVANPYITKLGDKASSEQRLNFAQSFNGVGAFVAPIVGGQFILSGIEHTPEELKRMSPSQLAQYLSFEASTVKTPYIVIFLVVMLVAVFFLFTKLKEVKEGDSDEENKSFSLGVLKYSHVRWAIAAEFFYVGSQVGVGSFFIRFSRYVIQLPEKEAAWIWGFIGMVGFMVGRFVGTFLMKYIRPPKLLTIYALINIGLLTIALISSGKLAVYSLLAVPFFMSIMFPTIFALGIKGLGEDGKVVSSFLVMSIVGGAFIPLFMGMVSDRTGSIQWAYTVPLLCFFVIFYYGWRGHRSKLQGQMPALSSIPVEM